MNLTWGKVPVPVTALWSGEDTCFLAPDPIVNGMMAMCNVDAPGVGKPIFGKPHTLASSTGSDAPWAGVYKAPQFTNDATARSVRRKKRPAHMGHIEAGAYTSNDGGPKLMRSVIYAHSEHGQALHPTQKPLTIVEPMLLYACPPGGIVLDIFAGSGTVGVAARRNGMSAVLVEANDRFESIIHARLEDDGPLLARAHDAAAADWEAAR